ncbi:hypothetical protein GCM10023065_31640 [Microbacterium laevaniformans]|uniref:hypothetical protein n=1 Tax=Microbacterium laevaniformans TaxID=36807 RepID=UPI0031E95C50
MEGFPHSIGQWAEAVVDTLDDALRGFFDAAAFVLGAVYDGVDAVLMAPPFWVIVVVFAALAFAASGWRLAGGTALGLLLIVAVDQWDNAMDTLALVIVAALVAIVIAIPVGIWAARNDTASRIVRPVSTSSRRCPRSST